MGRLVEVKGHSDLKMDVESGAVINTNKTAIELARERKRIRAKKKNEQEVLKQEVATLKQDMNIIKNMLQSIMEKM